MKSKIIFLLVFICLPHCGFDAIYSKKNIDLKINSIEKENTILNNEISNALKSIYSDVNATNVINLKIKSEKFLNVKSKDKKGDPSIQLLIKVNLNIANQNGEELNKEFSKSINFNNSEDKFQLSKYQSELEKILIKKLIEDINNYLANIQ